jgi:predicted permease
MSSMRSLLARLRNTLLRRESGAALDEEMQFHLDMLAARLEREGVPAGEARRRALVTFGGRERFKEAARDEAHSRPLDELMQDVRFGVRSALRVPLFTLLAIVTLALGIGANAAVFGVVKSVLLDALPYADAGRLVRVYSQFNRSPTERSSISPGTAVDVAERVRSFASVSAFNFTTFDNTLVDETGPRILSGALVDGAFFSTLGVRAAIGRALTDADAGVATVALSHAAWQRELGGAPDVVGRTLRIDGQAFEVVGVLPRGFVGPMGEADVFYAFDPRTMLSDPAAARDQHWLGIVGRLAPGIPLERAAREIDALGVTLAREHPKTDGGRTFLTLPLRDSLVGDTRTPLLVLMASAGLVLLITCANLAGALLSRTLSRRKELAVRVALGAGRGRLVRQLLTESVLLAFAGAAVGLLLATLGLGALRTMALDALPPFADLSLDAGAVLVTLLFALCTGVAFSIAPALAASRWEPQGTLREETRGASESRRSRRLRGALVAAQIALSLSLLAGAGLLARSLWAMATAPLGFEPDGVLVADVQVPSSVYPTAEERARFYDAFRERLVRLSGAQVVATASQLPSPTMTRNALTIEGVVLEGDGPTFIPYLSVSDDFFRALAIDLLQGRTFAPQDAFDATPSIVVSETMARRYWPDGGAVGARIRISPQTAERWGTVVGIVRDVRMDPALLAPEPLVYASNRQDIYRNGRTVVIRTAGDPLALVRPAQRELSALDAGIPLRDPTTLRAVIDERLQGRRLPVLLMMAFGALALVLASVGVYAMFAAMAAAREREFGVRLALGSSPRAIAALVLRQGAAWMAAGLAGGAVGVLLVSRLLQDLVAGVPRFDPVALGLAFAALLACGVVALLVPVRRATRVDPISILR